jgi:hypothetical protein
MMTRLLQSCQKEFPLQLMLNEVKMENVEKNEVLEEINNEIQETKRKNGEDPENFEIELSDESNSKEEEQKAIEEDKQDDLEYSKKVEKRIKKLVDQRRDAELQTKSLQEQNSQLEARLSRLEQTGNKNAESNFHKRYNETKQALHKAVEEGDTTAQVNFQEQLADMRAAMRIAEVQKQQRVASATSPTVGRAQQVAQAPAPPKAMDWWQKNRWFNANGFDRETAAARAIDVQLDVEGFDKDSDDYYSELDTRLGKVFPDLKPSGESPVRQEQKRRQPVAPTAGGSPIKTNRVRMSQDQLRMARELGITDEKGLKQYSAEIQKQQRG